MPTKADVSKTQPSKKQLLRWIHQHEQRRKTATEQLRQACNAAPSSQLDYLVNEINNASYAIGALHADLAEGRFS
jgi:hypothetical protein